MHRVPPFTVYNDTIFAKKRIVSSTRTAATSVSVQDMRRSIPDKAISPADLTQRLETHRGASTLPGEFPESLGRFRLGHFFQLKDLADANPASQAYMTHCRP